MDRWAELCHAEDVAIKGVSIDSRQVQPGNLFIPLKGERADGHRYLESAVHNGASAALWNVDEPLPEFDFPLILVKDTMSALTNWRRVIVITVIFRLSVLLEATVRHRQRI